MSIKMLREHLCLDQARWQQEWPDEVRNALGELIKAIDRHRPLANNGKHGNLHTETCGCNLGAA